QINSYFSDGRLIEDTINDLVSGKLKPQNLQAIRKSAKFINVLVKIVREIDEKA
ncbi:29660_t:CDS:2, partial [Gigaspora margarita]